MRRRCSGRVAAALDAAPLRLGALLLALLHIVIILTRAWVLRGLLLALPLHALVLAPGTQG